MGSCRHFLAVAGLCLAAAQAGAQITNGSFEDTANPLNGYTLGAGARVQVLQASSFGTNTIPVPNGSRFALLSTGPGDVPGTPGGDLDANGTAEQDVSTLSASFTTTAASQTLSLSWSFLTDEVGPGTQGDPRYDDIFDITVDGVSILRGSVHKPGGISPYPDTAAYDGRLYTVTPAGLTNGSRFGTGTGGGRTPFQSLCVRIATAGVHTLRFLVADQRDALEDSGLLVDAIGVATGCDPTVQVTSSSGASLQVKGGSFVFTPVTHGRPSISAVGPLIAFRGNGNYNGDNPNLQEQVWTAAPSGAAYTIRRITSAVGATFGDPQLDANAQWLTFTSNGNLKPPGNPDGNFEVFRYEIGTGALTQITSTTGCTNETSTIGAAGARIAFVSDCGLAPGAPGREIVLWDGTGFRGRNTSGCTSRIPRISRNATGRYVTFVTTCAGQYPGVANADGGEEIVRWDLQTDLYLPVTNTPSGYTNDSAMPSADGRYVAFVSNANHGGQNATNSFVTFRYDTVGGTLLRLTNADPLALITNAAIDDLGGLVALERVNLATSAFEIYFVDAAFPGTLVPVALGSPTVTNEFPAIARASGRAVVAYRANGNPTGGNADTNVEIYTGGGVVAAPLPAYCSTSFAIPDRGQVFSTINVTDPGVITDLNISLHIQHPWVGDLRIQLRNGAASWLIDRPGAPPGLGCSGDDIQCTLDDEAPLPVENQCVTPGPVAISGTFSPEQPLNRFDGQTLAGAWELRVFDSNANNAGNLVNWCLRPTLQ
jgi:hypothetical protein